MGYRVPMHEGGQGSEGYGVLPGIRSWAAVTENQAKLPFGLAGGLNRTHSMKHYQLIGIGVSEGCAEDTSNAKVLIDGEISKVFDNSLKIFVSLHQLINQVVKGVTGSSFRRSLLFYSPRILSKVSLRCAVSQLDMPSTIMHSPVLFPEQQDTFLLHGK